MIHSKMPKHRQNLRRLDLAQLTYLRAIARTGSVTGAADSLDVTPQTVSGQVAVLERHLGGQLLERAGRGVRLTDLGRMVFEYADDILGRAEDLLRAVGDPGSQHPAHFHVGVGNIVPKLVAYRFLRPVLGLADQPRLIVREGAEEKLFEELQARRLDAVIASGYTPTQGGLTAMELAVSRLAVFGMPELARRFRRRFPQSLNGAPLLLPGAGSPVRRFLDAWLAGNGIVPRIIGEFDDAGHREAFGAAGEGLFFTPDIIETDLKRQYGMTVIGRLPDVWARYFLVTPARSFIPPGEAAIHRSISPTGKGRSKP